MPEGQGEGNSTSDTLAPLSDHTFSDTSLEIKGNKTFRFLSSSGNKPSTTTGFTREESLRLNIAGKVQDTEVRANIYNSSTAEDQSEKMEIELKKPYGSLFFGNFTASFANSEFTLFSKNMDGVKINIALEPWNVDLIVSTPKGKSKRDILFGNDTQGPYQMTSYPVVVNSEKVFLDKRLKLRDQDYTIDYESGKITFKKDIVTAITQIEVDYEYRETLYARSLMGGQATYHFSKDLQIGVTVIKNEDQAEGQSFSVAPVRHFVGGVSAKWNASPELVLEGEFAKSEKDEDLSSNLDTVSTGYAARAGLSYTGKSLNFTSHYKRISSLFESLGNSSLQPGLKDFDWSGHYSFDQVTFIEGNYVNQEYLSSGQLITNTKRQFKTQFPIPLVSLLKYQKQEDETNSGADQNLRGQDLLNLRKEFKAGESFLVLPWTVDLAYQQEKVNDTAAPASNYMAKALSAGWQSSPWDGLKALLSGEYRRKELASGEQSSSKKYTVNLDGRYTQAYSVNGTYTYMEDSLDGSKSLADLSYSAAPSNLLSSKGKYTIDFLKETYQSDTFLVEKHKGSFSFKSSPSKQWQLSYDLQPWFSIIKEVDKRYKYSLVEKKEILWAPLQNLSFGVNDYTSSEQNIDDTDLNWQRVKDSRADHNQACLAKIALSNDAILDMRYETAEQYSKALDTSNTANVIYSDAKNRSQTTAGELKYSAIANWVFNLKMEEVIQTVLLPSENATLKNSGGLEIKWYPHRNFSLTAGESLIRNIDYGSGLQSFSHAPRLSIAWKPLPAFDIYTELQQQASYSGEELFTETILCNLKYSINQFAFFKLDGKRERSQNPNWENTEFNGQLSLTF